MGNSQYVKSPMGLPKMGLCTFLKTVYKKYLMSELAAPVSNLPQYTEDEESCPFKAVSSVFHRLSELKNLMSISFE